jgi:hypothetical protein
VQERQAPGSYLIVLPNHPDWQAQIRFQDTGSGSRGRLPPQAPTPPYVPFVIRRFRTNTCVSDALEEGQASEVARAESTRNKKAISSTAMACRSKLTPFVPGYPLWMRSNGASRLIKRATPSRTFLGLPRHQTSIHTRPVLRCPESEASHCP